MLSALVVVTGGSCAITDEDRDRSIDRSSDDQRQTAMESFHRLLFPALFTPRDLCSHSLKSVDIFIRKLSIPSVYNKFFFKLVLLE